VRCPNASWLSAAVEGSLAHLLSILSSLLVGLVLTVVPWTPFWDANSMIYPHPHLRALVLSGFFRGAVTGIGLVNVLVAALELRHPLGPTDGHS